MLVLEKNRHLYYTVGAGFLPIHKKTDPSRNLILFSAGTKRGAFLVAPLLSPVYLSFSLSHLLFIDSLSHACPLLLLPPSPAADPTESMASVAPVPRLLTWADSAEAAAVAFPVGGFDSPLPSPPPSSCFSRERIRGRWQRWRFWWADPTALYVPFHPQDSSVGRSGSSGRGGVSGRRIQRSSTPYLPLHPKASYVAAAVALALTRVDPAEAAAAVFAASASSGPLPRSPPALKLLPRRWHQRSRRRIHRGGGGGVSDGRIRRFSTPSPSPSIPKLLLWLRRWH